MNERPARTGGRFRPSILPIIEAAMEPHGGFHSWLVELERHGEPPTYQEVRAMIYQIAGVMPSYEWVRMHRNMAWDEVEAETPE